jgi:hypothetical protein
MIVELELSPLPLFPIPLSFMNHLIKERNSHQPPIIKDRFRLGFLLQPYLLFTNKQQKQFMFENKQISPFGP